METFGTQTKWRHNSKQLVRIQRKKFAQKKTNKTF